MIDTIAILELYSRKELIVLKKLIQDRMNCLKDISELQYTREDTFEYLTLGQIAVRLPQVQEQSIPEGATHE